jgi:Mlc titration factor MtfA (ptsG expression regulator)
MTVPQAAWLLAGVGCAAVLAWLLTRWRRSQRLQMIHALPFPESWRRILEKNVPVYRHLPEHWRSKLENDIKWFLADKYFDGRNGLEITDEVRLTIAVQACLLLGRTNHRCYPKLSRIVVYPDAYVATTTERLGDVPVQRPQARLGESWQGGAVVLSWRHVLAGAQRPADGQNVVLHEFAHRLDQLSGNADGAPPLENSSQYRQWATVMSREFSSLRQRLQLNRKTWLNAYGATNPAEFFAVLTEYYFERPHVLKRHHPQLFKVMESYYGIDPVILFDATSEPENEAVDGSPQTRPANNERSESESY